MRKGPTQESRAAANVTNAKKPRALLYHWGRESIENSTWKKSQKGDEKKGRGEKTQAGRKVNDGRRKKNRSTGAKRCGEGTEEVPNGKNAKERGRTSLWVSPGSDNDSRLRARGKKNVNRRVRERTTVGEAGER